MTMEDIINSCLCKAANRFPGQLIMYCGATKSWDKCLTIVNNNIMFWYNVNGGTYAEMFSHQHDAITVPK